MAYPEKLLAPEAFDAAYFERPLNDIELDPLGVYHLNGPYVKLVDLEEPAVPPTTSRTGKWLDKRGNNGFNDAMTYFHLDQSWRYAC